MAISCVTFLAINQGTWTVPSSGSSSGSSSSVSTSKVKRQCQEYVEALLVAPSTAQFESLLSQDIWTLEKESGKYKSAFRVEAHVDAQNSFGAMIRNYYTCDINYLGNDKWELLDLDIY